MEEMTLVIKTPTIISQPHSVPIGQMVVSQAPADVLVAYGVGSCIAVCMYDPSTNVGGMLHALLPKAPGGGAPSAKFVDQGIPLLLQDLLRRGAQKDELVAYLCGGAQVLTAAGFENSLHIGAQNIKMAQATIQANGIRLVGQAIGGDTGRTVRLYISDGQVTVKSMGQNEQPIGNPTR